MANRPRIVFGSGSQAQSNAVEDREPPPPPPPHTASVSATASTPAAATGSSELPMISVNSLGDRLLPSGDTSREMTRIFHGRLTAGTSWSKVHRNVRASYFYEFKKHFQWAPEIDSLVQSTFNKHAGVRYNDLVNKAKHGWYNGAKVRVAISEEVWEAWKAHWASEDAKKKSQQASANRLSEVGGPGTGISKHTCGSKSMFAYERDLEKSSGKSPSMTEVFYHTHTKNHDGKTFIDKRSEAYSAQLYEAVESRRAQTPSTAGSGTLSSTPIDVDEDEVYLELATQQNKGRVYGVGNYSARGRSTSSTALSTPTIQPTQQQADANEAMMHRIVREAMLSHREVIKNDMEEIMRKYFNRDQQPPPPPPPSGGQ